MSASDTHSPRTAPIADPRLPEVHTTMAREANGFYTLMSTICSAFLGGALVFSERVLVDSPLLSRALLVAGIAGLTLCLALLSWVRWGNVESYRMYAEALRDQDMATYERLRARGAVERRKTRTAVWSFTIGLSALAAFAAERVINHPS